MRRPNSTQINFNVASRKVDVDNRISLRNYYRIADNLLKQANIYREEKNLTDLYVILLRYSSLVAETIPHHRDYQALCKKERLFTKKKLSAVLDELESLKPQVRQLDQLDQTHQIDGQKMIPDASAGSFLPALNNKPFLSYDNKRLSPVTAPSSTKQNNEYTRVSSSHSIDTQFQKLSLGLPLPKQETLSRHSFLGPNGLRGQWQGPSAEVKVNYPTSIVHDLSEISSLNQVGQYEPMATKDKDSEAEKSTMESVLSLDVGNLLHLLFLHKCSRSYFLSLHQELLIQDLDQQFLRTGCPVPIPYQDLHIPVKMMEDFLRLARENTRKNLETCGVLAGSLRNRVFQITTLIIPKQESTSDSCQTLNEEEIFEIQDKRSLFQLGWIHTHPTQTCFMSSVDLHTHYSYQVMLPEAIAIVMAPTDSSSPHGIFHLSDPGGVSVMRNCQQRGFHPHEEPEDGSPIYEHCSHVYMNPKLMFDMIDLR
ncbi:AMSH-like ubiquitin thioesterase 3 [Abeliophyllum distichum]|uniref:AMSH-like ubiquitin thioesterase 3 n=1 Tax=Abeliophyllum distichum TaxID=126358 RepID=A0ABD1T2H3_9LAMI